MICLKPELGQDRRGQREGGLQAAEAEVQPFLGSVAQGGLQGPTGIGMRTEVVLEHHQAGKHLPVEIRGQGLEILLNEERTAKRLPSMKGIWEVAQAR